MKQQNEPLETLKEIRTLMERSSRFLSLSGLSGLIAGLAAIAGIAAAYLYLGLGLGDPGYSHLIRTENGETNVEAYTFLALDLLLVLMISLLGAGLMTIKKARQEGQSVWDASAKRLVYNLSIPLGIGGFYCLTLLYHGHMAWIAPATLIFYGLALINASKYTLDHIRYLGLVQVLIGLVAGFFLDYGLLFWALGFGMVHIVYGIIMYFKYER